MVKQSQIEGCLIYVVIAIYNCRKASAMKQSDVRGTLEKLGLLLERTIYPFSRWISIVSMVASLAMMFLVTADVLGRRFFAAPILGSTEISQRLLAIIIFCAVAWVMTIKGHVEVDIFFRFYPRRLQAVVYSIALFFSLIIVGAISWGSTLNGLNKLQVGETSVLLKLPMAPFIFVVAFGAAVLFFVILVQFIQSIAGRKG